MITLILDCSYVGKPITVACLSTSRIRFRCHSKHGSFSAVFCIYVALWRERSPVYQKSINEIQKPWRREAFDRINMSCVKKEEKEAAFLSLISRKPRINISFNHFYHSLLSIDWVSYITTQKVSQLLLSNGRSRRFWREKLESLRSTQPCVTWILLL
jgi:hypothetical protein